MKHYEDNLAELKANLDGHEKAQKAQDKERAKEYLRKTKLHLEKTKAPSKHIPLDPNNLPFKARKAAKTVAPRLKKEDFEKDFPQQKKQKGKFTAEVVEKRIASWSEVAAGFNLHEKAINHKPILLAFNGPASDVPLQLPRPLPGEGWGRPSKEFNGGEGATPQIAFSDSSLFLLAQAVVQPTPDDLAETPEVQFTDAIRAKAQELGGKPVKIYEWVRNNIEYAPTYGSIQGADQCLQSKICNDMDTASLLIALLRVSGVYSHYEYSTIEIPIEQAMNWVGGVTDPKMVGTILATNGIPVKVLISGGTIKSVQIEHATVSAFIDYIPSRGAVHKQGDTWIPLDPSFKQYTYAQGIDIGAAVPFDAQSFADQLVATSTTNTVEGYVTNVDSAYIQQTMQDYQTQVQNYMTQNNPNATVGDVIGKKEIIKQEFPILMGTLPYKTVQIGAEFAEIPGNYRATMSFSIPDQTWLGVGLSYSTSLPEIAGKKITLSFAPATDTDLEVIQSYLPKPHTDGTSIQLSEFPATYPAYLRVCDKIT